MDPILATGALSLAGQVVRNLTANKEPKSAQLAPADKARFADLLARASSSPQVQMAKFLEERGLHSVGEAERRVEQLSTQLLQTPEVQSFIAGSGSSVTMQIGQDGGMTIRTADGRERTFQLADDGRKLSSEIHAIGAALRGSSGMRSDSLSGPVTMRVTPGVGVSIESVSLRKS